MTKSKLLIALTAGLFASTAVFAQSNASQGAMTPNTATSGDMSTAAPAATPKKHRMRRTGSKGSTGINSTKTKTPDVTTSASPGAENGQGQ